MVHISGTLHYNMTDGVESIRVGKWLFRDIIIHRHRFELTKSNLEMTPPFAMNTILHEAKIEHQRDLTPLPNSSDSDLLPKDAIHVCNHDFYVNFLASKFL